MRAEYLKAFEDHEVEALKPLLASHVIAMGGRKLEEGDWTSVYCAAKGIPASGWSNLDIDVVHGALGVEHKMLSTGAKRPSDKLGQTLMHPSMTRSIRIPDTDDETEAMVAVLGQYGELVEARRQRIEGESRLEADLRLGWLLWQTDLSQFLYFEERMGIPDPGAYYAQWNEISRRGRRKPSRNLWIFDKDSDRKRYSVTTSAGAKIQPYFDVPSVDSELVYVFTVEGEEAEGGVRLWLSPATLAGLQRAAGDTSTAAASRLITETAAHVDPLDGEARDDVEPASPVTVTYEAYEALTTVFGGRTADERLRRLLGEVVVDD